MNKKQHTAESDPKQNQLSCYHCGEPCLETTLLVQDRAFCCQGCKLVYELLSENNLCTYYDLEKNPGQSQKMPARPGKFAFLDDESVAGKLITFRQNEKLYVTFYLPQMHCSSCIWLLENIHRLDKGILSARVDFPKKEISIVFQQGKITLRRIAELLTSIGYEPHISLHDISQTGIRHLDRNRLYRLGVAGFTFGNIMLLSFPEYFSLGSFEDPMIQKLFSYINLTLSIPVFFYSAGEFFSSAWKSLKKNFLNIDAPIALAVIITFLRSLYEIFTETGAGYLDSMTGIVFFMLTGRVFQDMTYKKLSFDRDFKSFFPVAVAKLEDGNEIYTALSKLVANDHVVIHNNELIPADALLVKGKARIDYSFVTGESDPVSLMPGELLYAGGRQTGESIEIRLNKAVSQSYLTSLWNKHGDNTEDKQTSFIHKLSKQFTIVLFLLVFITATYWAFNDPSKILNAVTAMLIIACPCALLLAATFTNGNVIRILAKAGMYLKNATVIEAIAESNALVLDKTGTITRSGESEIQYFGRELSGNESEILKGLFKHSVHPLSKALVARFSDVGNKNIVEFEEISGSGLKGMFGSILVKAGSADWIGVEDKEPLHTKVHVSFNGVYAGYFLFKNRYRLGIQETISALSDTHKLALLSGDKASEKETLSSLFPQQTAIYFGQMPDEKRNYIQNLQIDGYKVLMAGDGLNDAAALAQSNVGVAVTDDTNLFSPACDAILHGNRVHLLHRFIRFCKDGKNIVIATFVISIVYNLIGLWFSVQGTLSPVIAAILMPASTITIVLFTTGMSTLMARKRKIFS